MHRLLTGQFGHLGERAVQTRAHADESVEQGRAYVAAYIDLAHYAERLLESATAPASSHDGAPAHAQAEAHAH